MVAEAVRIVFVVGITSVRIGQKQAVRTWARRSAIPPEFVGYSANLTVESLASGNIQKLTIVIERFDDEVLTLESLKVER